MGRMARAAIAALIAGVFAVGAAAQATIDVPENLTPGQVVTINFSDPTRSGGSVVIEIDNGGFPLPIIITLTVPLDAKGEGSIVWVVPIWDGARFNAPGAKEVTRGIN